MKTLMTATALAALVAASPAFAQSTDMQTPSSPPATTEPSPAPGAPPADAPSAAPDSTMPNTGGSATPDAASPDTAAAPSDMFLTEQAPDDQLASALIGANVQNGADENLGAINDIVLSEDGQIDAVVIGVGGFLGIGEKNVAVNFDSIDKSTDADGNVQLRLEATREQLESAPAFVTVAESRQDQESTSPAAPASPSPAAP